MKAYTNIEQSKKLAKILPLESADMFYNEEPDETYPKDIDTKYPMVIRKEQKHYLEEYGVPCWTLAALLGVLPFHLVVNNQRYVFSMIKGLDKNGETYAIKYTVFNTTFYLHLTDFYNNPVDACYEMILKLHEEKMFKVLKINFNQ